MLSLAVAALVQATSPEPAEVVLADVVVTGTRLPSRTSTGSKTRTPRS